MTEETIASLEVPALVTYARAAGRLDFNIGYDITDKIRFDVGGTNILGSNTSTYYDYPGYTNINNEMSYDETTYRSEEHTSELQSLMRISYAVFCLNKKNNKDIYT